MSDSNLKYYYQNFFCFKFILFLIKNILKKKIFLNIFLIKRGQRIYLQYIHIL